MMAQNKILVSERIFLTPTQVYYDKNDTVEIIGQILSTDYSDFYPYSRYVYLELFDKDSKLVSRQKVKCNEKWEILSKRLHPIHAQPKKHLLSDSSTICRKSPSYINRQSYHKGFILP